jgi:superoxide reductase
MAKLMSVYKCERCGNIIQVLHGDQCKIRCCAQDMVWIKPNTVDAAQEKHIPVIEKSGDNIKVKIGSVPHPMEDDHFIEWIQLLADDVYCSAFLKPGGAPEKVINIEGDNLSAFAYCNLHGLWKGE